MHPLVTENINCTLSFFLIGHRDIFEFHSQKPNFFCTFISNKISGWGGWLTKLFCGLYIVENIFHFLACFQAVECPLKFFTLRKVSKKFGIVTHVICLGEKLNCFSSSCELLKVEDSEIIVLVSHACHIWRTFSINIVCFEIKITV